MLAIALILGLSAGVVDVCVGLLNKPRGFETVPSLSPPILAVAVVTLALFLGLWLVLRPIVMRTGLDAAAAAWALAAFLRSAFSMALLAGFHIEPASPQLLFKATAAAALATVMAAGVYNLTVGVNRQAQLREWCGLLVLALPLLLFEVLAYEWVEVYAIDHVVSAVTAFTTICFGAAALATIGIVQQGRRRFSAVRVLTTFAVALALGAALGAAASRRAMTVQASGSRTGHTPARIILITIDTL